MSIHPHNTPLMGLKLQEALEQKLREEAKNWSNPKPEGTVSTAPHASPPPQRVDLTDLDGPPPRFHLTPRGDPRPRRRFVQDGAVPVDIKGDGIRNLRVEFDNAIRQEKAVSDGLRIELNQAMLRVQGLITQLGHAELSLREERIARSTAEEARKAAEGRCSELERKIEAAKVRHHPRSHSDLVIRTPDMLAAEAAGPQIKKRGRPFGSKNKSKPDSASSRRTMPTPAVSAPKSSRTDYINSTEPPKSRQPASSRSRAGGGGKAVNWWSAAATKTKAKGKRSYR